MARSAEWRLLLIASFAIAALGTKFWIIASYGNATPFWDQWDGEAANLYVPFFDSTLHFDDLLRPHNEHRILVTRILALALISANGLWDPILQMMLNGIVHVGFGIALLVLLQRDVDDDGAFVAFLFVVLAIIALPFAVESDLLGFQTHFYAFLLLGTIGLAAVTRRRALSPGWLLGAGAGLGAFFSLASGAFVLLAGAIILLGKLVLRASRGLREWLGAALLFGGFAAMIAFVPIIPEDLQLRARSIAEFLQALPALMGWPLGGAIGAVVVNLPALIVAIRTIRRPPADGSIEWTLLGLWLWIGLSLAATAYGRAIGVGAPRYLDIAAAGIAINYVSAVRLAEGSWKRLAAIGWAVLISGGLLVHARHLPHQLAAHRRMAHAEEANVRAFLSTGAFPPGAASRPFDLPYPDAGRLAQLLSDQRVQRFLPANLQSAIHRDATLQAPRDRLGFLRDALLAASAPAAIAGFLALAVLIAFGLRRPQSRWRL